MTAITVDKVWKKYKLFHDRSGTLKEKLLFRNRSSHEEKWVLKEVSFIVKKGETIGLVGENGSGKSTLLKLLTRIIYPNKGSINVTGKVSSLLELGAGFHPDMSGLENIFMNASIFGLTKPEIESRLNSIISFSEMDDFIDSPVRTYSSGMYMRLAFSVAINVEADVLLIDEIIAVGDSYFQSKCFAKLEEMKGRGKTIIIVSHDLNSIEDYCNKVIWLNNGEVVTMGCPKDTIARYLEAVDEKKN